MPTPFFPLEKRPLQILGRLALLAGLGLTACTSAPPPAPAATVTPPPTLAETTPSVPVIMPPNFTCAAPFEKRELLPPYKSADGQPRYTLSQEEFDAALATMGITSVCVPTELGAPYVAYEWNDTQPGVQGRMIMLGFDNAQPESGWHEGTLVFATYDFSAGTEYEVFAHREDWENVHNGTMSNTLEIDGIAGFQRVKPADYSFGTQNVYQTWVFPFETAYVAVVYRIGAYPFDSDWDALLPRLEAGEIPVEQQIPLLALKHLARTLRFIH